MADLAKVLADPEFQSFSPEEQEAVLSELGLQIPAPAQASMVPEGSAAGRFLSGAAEQLNPLRILGALGEMLVDPEAARQAGVGARQQMGEQWEKAGGEFFGPDGSIIKGLGHALAGSIPLIGPAAAQAGERLGEAIGGGGDVAGAAGSAAGLVGGALIPGAAARVIPRAGSAIAGSTGRVIAPIRRGFQRAELEALQGGTATKALASGAREALTKGGLEARKAFLKEQLGVPKPHGHGAPRPKPPAPKPPTTEPEAPKLKPAAKAKLEHAIARGAKEAGKELPKATVKTLRDEITEHVANGARAELTRQQIIEGLKQRIGSENFSPGAAGRIVDDIAKGLKVELVTTPGATARAAGQSLNQQIAAAQAKSGVAPHRGVGSIADEIRAKRMAENAAKAAAPRGASLLDEMTDQARTMARSTGLTPEEMVQALKKFNPGVGDREAFAAVQRAMRGAQ